MELNTQGLTDRKQWEEKGYILPRFDREKAAAAARENPFWIHFGAGNIFRAFQANVVQRLLEQGVIEQGLIVAEGFDHEIIEKIYRPHDNYSILVTLKGDGEITKTVVGSVTESLLLDSENEEAYKRLKDIFSKDSLQMATFTITEKGYCLTDSKGGLLPDVTEDFIQGPKKPKSYMGKITALLYTRYETGEKPLAMVSMDNCSHNGEKLYAAVHAFAMAWIKNGRIREGFLDYIKDKDKVSFPWTMIDKITPRPDDKVKALLEADGLKDQNPVITAKHTYIAPYVNGEECEYLVIEDAFPNGRPKLEKGGVFLTSRETVEKAEKMKVCTCLNPLHTALAVYGCLLGYEKISDEMKDPELKKLAGLLGYQEGLPAAADPGILNPEEFLDKVLKERLPNPFLLDTPQRIATDTSQKLAIRFGETIKAYERAEDLDVRDLKGIPLVFAGWLRYLMGTDDKGETFDPSPDPLLEQLCPRLCVLKLVRDQDIEKAVAPVLKMKSIFGVDLYEAGLAGQVIQYMKELTEGPGAVRKTLKKYL